MEQNAQALATAQSRFSVDKYTIAAVWGVESNFGDAAGKYQLVRSLATLSCLGRRAGEFKGELISTL